MDRRQVMKTLALATSGLMLPGPKAAAWARPRLRQVQAHGLVMVDGRPRAGVPVTDGRSVVLTDPDGAYRMATSTDRGFIRISLPGDVAVPMSEAGTAAFYRPIVADPGGEMVSRFNLHTLEAASDRHALLLLADPQVQDQRDIDRMHAESIPALRRTVRDLGPRHAVGVAAGDIMYDNLEHFGAWEHVLREAGLPGFQVLGNHDLDVASRTDLDSALPFQRRFGPTWYSFDRGEVHVVVLDDVFWWGHYMGYLDRTQLDWLAADLTHVEPGRRVLVCVHIPTWCTRHERYDEPEAPPHLVVANRELLYELLAPYQATVLCGHMHELEILQDGPVDVHVCGALCGAWWTGDICGDGAPNGFMVYEIDGGQVRWRYQASGHGPEHQMRLYAPGADPDRADELVANIWAADPNWGVIWYADGECRGAMARYRGVDPLARRLYSGPEAPDHRPWVEAFTTDHLYACRPEPAVRKVTVEARDSWGRIYREHLELA